MAWPTKTANPPQIPTLRRIGYLAAATAATKVKPAPPWLARAAFGPAATFTGEEEAHEWSKVPPAFVKVEAEASVKAVACSVTFSMPGAVEVVSGPVPSPTNEKHGLPLPFPSILANPGRVGPPRFSAADRKTLGLD